jgi:hypothetical protein
MIAQALAIAEKSRSGPRLPHAQYILRQYAKLCQERLVAQEPSVEFVLVAATRKR